MAAKTITDVLLGTPKSLHAEEEEIAHRTGGRDEPACRTVLLGLKLHLLGLEEQYPEAISVSYVETRS